MAKVFTLGYIGIMIKRLTGSFGSPFSFSLIQYKYQFYFSIDFD